MESTNININSFEDLIEFIENHKVSKKDIENLVSETMKIYFIKEYESREEMISDLKDFYLQYGDYEMMPLFINCDLDVVDQP